MPELYDTSEESDEENASLNDGQDDEGDLWVVEDLIGPRTGKFRSEPPAFPKYKPKMKPGPTFLHPGTTMPVDFVHLYFDDSIMNCFVINTNLVGVKLIASLKKNSKGPNKSRWIPTTIAELYRLFAVFLHMGMKRQPSMRSYWSNDPRYSDAFVKKSFARDRFEILKKCLHLVDPSAFTQEEIKSLQKANPFWRVSPLLDHLTDVFQRYFTCGQNLDIDEMCIGFKGRHVARCYNPNKPEKWHLKAFCLNDSASGYLHQFYMYQGFTFNYFFNVPNKSP